MFINMNILRINKARRDCFDNISLHESLPNLKQFGISGLQRDDPIILPNMNCCEKLETVNLMFGCFRMPGLIPFPHGLTELSGAMQILKLNSHMTGFDRLMAIQNHCPNCDLGDQVRDLFYEIYD